MQISISLVTVIRNMYTESKNAMQLLNILRWTDVLTLKICWKGQGMNLLTCFNTDLYRVVLCKTGNGMHKDLKYSQLSSCAHACNANSRYNYLISTAECCLLTRTLTRGPDGDCSFNVEEIFGLGLSRFEK